MLRVYVTRSQNHTAPRTQERNYGDLLERHDETIQGPQGQALLPWEEEQELARLDMHRAPGRMQWEHEALQDRTLSALLGDAEAEEGEEGRKGGRVPALEGGGDDVSRAGGGGAGAFGALDEGRVPLGPAVGVASAEGAGEGGAGERGGQGVGAVVGGAREEVGVGRGGGRADIKGAGEGRNERTGVAQDAGGEEVMWEGGGERADWNEAEECEGGERESEESGADPGMLVMQREAVRQQVLQEEAVRRGNYFSKVSLVSFYSKHSWALTSQNPCLRRVRAGACGDSPARVGCGRCARGGGGQAAGRSGTWGGGGGRSRRGG